MLKKGQKIRFMGTGAAHLVDRVGCMTPKIEQVDELGPGRDRLHHRRRSRRSARPGRRHDHRRASPPRRRCRASRKSSRWCSAACSRPTPPISRSCATSLDKLRLNDASFEYEETSAALGFGFRCGFLGLLHLEIIQERLEREYDLDLITTAPSVVYRVHQDRRRRIELHNPADMPDPNRIDHVEEPWIKATI